MKTRYGSRTGTGIRIQEVVQFDGDIKVDAEAGIIRGVRVLNRESRNNRTYSDRALTDIAELLDGKQSYADHSDKKGRSIREQLGIFVNARADHRSGSVVADLKVVPREDWLLATAQRIPEAIKMSIDAQGLVTKRGGRELVNRIAELHSVDAVTEGGTTHGLFESRKEDEPMDIESLADLKGQHADLLEQYRAEVEEEFKAGSDAEAKAVALEADLKATREKAEKAEKRLEELETAKKVAEHAAAVDAAITEAKLPEFAVTDDWRKSLVALDADGLKAAIDDRRKLIENASGKKSVSQERQSTSGDMKIDELKEALTE